jgi:hypothetical protein
LEQSKLVLNLEHNTSPRIAATAQSAFCFGSMLFDFYWLASMQAIGR